MEKLITLVALTFISLCLFISCGGQKDEHTHNFGEWEVAKAPTCSTDGTKVRYCDCGEMQTESVPSVGHVVVFDKAVEPTCEGTGLTEGKHCSVCYEIIILQNEVPSRGHTEIVDKSVAPTCIKSGLTEGKHCKVCSKILVEQTIVDANGHREVIDAKVEATCTTIGLTEGKHCSVCRETIIAQIQIPIISHKYDNKYDDSCNVCGFIRDAECAHTNLTTLPSQKATCTEPGWTEGRACIYCKEIILAQIIIPANGHNTKTVVESKATCTEKGVEKTICTVCAATVEIINVPATGHSFSDKWMYDNNYHWHGATCGHNDAVSNKVIHNFDASGKCIVCDYQEQIKLDTPIITTVEYDKVYWSPVANATNYTITVNSDYTYTTASCSADISNVTYNGSYITKDGEVNITVQANGSGRYATSDKSTIHNYYYVPEKKDLSSDEAKLYNYGIGYGYNLIDYEAIDAEMISQIRVLNINKLLTLGEFYNPAITTGTVEASHFSSIDELNLHISGSYNRSSGLSIPAIGGIKNQFKIGLGVDYSKYDYNQTYKVQEDFIYKTYGIKDYTYDELKHCLTEAFVNDIKLAESMNEDAWLDYMYSKYGTHVILGVATGASYSATYTISTNKKDIAAQIDFEFESGLGLAFSDILSSDLGVGISLNGKADWSNEDTEAHFKIDWKGSTSGGTTTPSNLDSAIRSFESNINESNAVTIRFTTEGAISIGSLVAMVDASLGEKFESYVNDKGDEEFQKLYSQYTKPSTLPVSINIENGENVLKIDLSSYQNSGSLDNAYNANLLDGIFSVYPKMLGKRVDKIIIEGAFDEYNENLIDSFSIKLAKGWNKDVTIVVENLGVICASSLGIVDSSAVSSIYDINIEYKGVNLVRTQNGSSLFCTSINSKDYIFNLSLADDELLDCATITISDSIRLPLPSKSGYAFLGWYDKNGVQVTDIKGYIVSSYYYSGDIVTLNAEYTRSSQGLEFTSNGDGTCYVSGIGTCTDADVIIPPVSPEGDKVVAIGKTGILIGAYGFYKCMSLKSIEIPASVTSIGVRAFASCLSLTSVTFVEGSQLITIDSSAFHNCTSLASIELPVNVTSIGITAFYSCEALTSIEIPASVTYIGDAAFNECDSLTSIKIPTSVTYIGVKAFAYCDSLTEIQVAEGNTSYKDIDGNLYNYDGTTLIQYLTSKTDSTFAIPNSVTTIGSYAFSLCESLTSIEIPAGVTDIDYYAFLGCTNLTSIVIPDGVTSIGSDAFSYCSSLTSIIIPNSVTSIGSWAFYDCSSLTSIKYRGTQSQWNAITKGSDWDSYTGNYTITYNYKGN